MSRRKKCDCGECQKCKVRIQRASYYQKNKERIKANSAKYHKDNREAQLARMRANYEENLGERRAKARGRAAKKRSELVTFKAPKIEVSFVLGQGWVAQFPGFRCSSPSKRAAISKAQSAALSLAKLKAQKLT